MECRAWPQVDIHAPWGGVVPKLAQEAHEAAMDATVAAAMQEAGIAPQDLDAVAVTVGPGLSLCLKVGTPACISRQLLLPPLHAHSLSELSSQMEHAMLGPLESSTSSLLRAMRSHLRCTQGPPA
jgi:N6-L-threonylcarbamoyladenine synthase